MIFIKEHTNIGTYIIKSIIIIYINKEPEIKYLQYLNEVNFNTENVEVFWVKVLLDQKSVVQFHLEDETIIQWQDDYLRNVRKFC